VANFVYLRIVGKSVEVSAVIVMIALSFFGSLAGILGMFLSPIQAAVVRDLGYFAIRKLEIKEPFPDAPEPGFLQVISGGWSRASATSCFLVPSRYRTQ
jgi:predicted PurR-regulated permease PerM